MNASKITFAQRDAAAELRKAQRNRAKALQHMESPTDLSFDAEPNSVLGFLVADSVFEEKKAAAIQAFAPLMP